MCTCTRMERGGGGCRSQNKEMISNEWHSEKWKRIKETNKLGDDVELTEKFLPEGGKQATKVKINLILIRMCCNFYYFMLDCCSSACSQWILNSFHSPSTESNQTIAYLMKMCGRRSRWRREEERKNGPNDEKSWE